LIAGTGILLSANPLKAAALGIGCAVFFTGGLLLLSVGVLGEYIGRVYDEVRDRPISIISQVHRLQASLLETQSDSISLENGSYAIQPDGYSGKAKAAGRAA
jgi:polyisoprenyl-phosphate glycosyltransferase